MATREGRIGAGKRLGSFQVKSSKEDDLNKIKMTLSVAALLWPLFAFVDVFIVNFVHSGRLWLYLLYRSVGCMFLFAGVGMVYAFGRRVPTSAKLVETFLCYFSTALIALMSLEYNGIASPLVFGACLLILIRGVAIPRNWKDNAITLAGMAVVYPGTFIVLALLSKNVGAQFGSIQALATFALHCSYLFAMAVIGLWSGHICWREQDRNWRSSGGKYVLKRIIGKGGMGEVWLGSNKELGKDVAIKILKPTENCDPMASKRFEQEVHATSRLNHPHIVRIFDHGISEDQFFYYVMEYVPGIDLHDVVAHEGPLAPIRAIKIISQAARALAEAHRHGIIHRDLKPANIVLRRMPNQQDFIKVLDFGFAKLIDDKRQNLTQVGWSVGTPQYISPEMIRGQQIDGRSDIYGLGAVLYFLLTGQPPFNLGAAKANIFAHLEQMPTKPSVLLGKTLPNGLESIVLRCLAKKTERRFQSADDLAKALEYLSREIEVGRREESNRFVPKVLNGGLSSAAG